MSKEENMDNSDNLNVKYIQFEPGAFFSDIEMQTWSANEIGCYCMLIFSLYANRGKIRFDLSAMAVLTHCRRNFERVWNRIKVKFAVNDGVVSHKRVDKELREAASRIEKKRLAGSKGAQSRWQCQSGAVSDALANGNGKGNGNGKEMEREKDIITNSKERSISSSSSFRVRELHFNTSLENIIRPRTISDKTCFRNVTNWASKNIAEGKFNDEIFSRILDYAQMAKSAKKPAAAFMAILKKELDYHGP